MQSFLKENYFEIYDYLKDISQEEKKSILQFLMKSYNKSGIHLVIDEASEFLGIDKTEMEQKISGLTETEVHEMMDYFESVINNGKVKK